MAEVRRRVRGKDEIQSEEEQDKKAPILTAGNQRKLSYIFFIIAAVILVGLLFTTFQARWRVDTIRTGLLDIEKDIQLSPNLRVVVGFGGCVDVFLRGSELFELLGVSPPETVPTTQPEGIYTMEDIVTEYLTFFLQGAAAERYIQSEELYLHLTKVIWDKIKPDIVLGGNAPVIAKRMAEEGADVLLGVQNTKLYRDLIHPEIKMAGETAPSETQPDLHIILEFDKGESWGTHTAVRANRYILHRDHYNPRLLGLEAINDHILSFNPHLLVIGGLQMLDTYPFTEQELDERLVQLESFLSKVSASTLIHFEMASFVNADLLTKLLDKILPHCDSLGMNEQELPNLLSVLKTGKIVYISDSQIKVSKTLDTSRQLLSLINLREHNRVLSRLHIHTLAYQAVFTLSDSNNWKSGIAAAVKSSLTATRYVCGDQSIDSRKSRMILDESFSSSSIPGSQRIPIIDNTPVSCWNDGPYEICLAPVLVCTQIKQTAGGGDNLTGVGLLYHLK